MMNQKSKIHFFLVGLLLISFMGLNSCVDSPEFSDIPEIQFHDITFIDSENSIDSLILEIDFTDGDGNLGIDGYENYWPFHNRNYYSYFDDLKMTVMMSLGDSEDLKEDGIRYVFLHFNSLDDLNAFKSAKLPDYNNTYYASGYYGEELFVIRIYEFVAGYLPNSEMDAILTMLNDGIIHFENKAQYAELDSLPDFVDPYNCRNWEILPEQDTVYYSINPYFNNMYVKFYIEEQGSFQEFRWESLRKFPDCGVNFNGRFPYLLTDGEQERPLEGTIKYAMTSTGFLQLFSTKRMKLKIYIYDREFNRSNVIETPAFRLTDIKG